MATHDRQSPASSRKDRNPGHAAHPNNDLEQPSSRHEKFPLPADPAMDDPRSNERSEEQSGSRH